MLVTGQAKQAIDPVPDPGKYENIPDNFLRNDKQWF